MKKLIPFIICLIAFSNANAQSSETSKSGMIIIDSTTAVIIQTDLLTIPIYRQIIVQKDSTISLLYRRVALKDTNLEICKAEKKSLMSEKINLSIKVVKKNRNILILTGIIILENIILLR